MKTYRMSKIISFIFSLIIISLSSCKKENETEVVYKLPTVLTKEITNIDSNSLTIEGEVTNTGNDVIIARGFCWSLSNNPTIENNKITSGNGFGNFTSEIIGLQTNTTYHIRAFATNSIGTAYGNDLEFVTGFLNPNLTYGIVNDIEGNTYPTIEIGSQTWMAKNLKTSKFADASIIPNITSDSAWSDLNSPSWCNFQNNASMDSVYGKIYNWFAVIDDHNLCPLGWHVPTDSDWTTLINFLGGYTVAGGKMKSLNGWNNSQGQSGNGTNESGFSGLPGGYRNGNAGGFLGIGNYGGWWSSTEVSISNLNSYYVYITNSSTEIPMSIGSKPNGFSVRCIKD
jgi:uncharacterized protein (TIGR02145 family)